MRRVSSPIYVFYTPTMDLGQGNRNEEGKGRGSRRVSSPRYVFFLYFFFFDYTNTSCFILHSYALPSHTRHQPPTSRHDLWVGFFPSPTRDDNHPRVILTCGWASTPPTSHFDSLVGFYSPHTRRQPVATTHELLRLVGGLHLISNTTNESF